MKFLLHFIILIFLFTLSLAIPVKFVHAENPPNAQGTGQTGQGVLNGAIGGIAGGSIGNPYVNDPIQAGKDFVNMVQNPNDMNDWNYSFRYYTKFISQGSIILGNPIILDKDGNPIVIRNAGAIGFVANNIDTLIKNRPASSIDYIAYESHNLKIPGTPQPVLAAGSMGYGFTSLSFLLPFWTITRNLAYIAFALIFILIGVMIVFRIKIDPKTAASIQNALPKIIFALLLVSFSYPIAGFLIDLMYVLMNLVFTIFSFLPGYQGTAFSPQIFFDKVMVKGNSVLDFYTMGPGAAAATNTSWALGKLVVSWFTNLQNVSSDKITQSLSTGVGVLLGVISGGLGLLILNIMLIWSLLRTLFSLLSAYISIILNIIFSPLILMAEAIPGQHTFSNWLRNLAANLLVAPVVTIMLLLGAALTESHGTTGTGFNFGYDFVLPLLGGGTEPGAVQALIGFGIILTTPRVINILQDAFKTPPFKYGNAWNENMKPVQGLTAGVLQGSSTIPIIGGGGKGLYYALRNLGFLK